MPRKKKEDADLLSPDYSGFTSLDPSGTGGGNKPKRRVSPAVIIGAITTILAAIISGSLNCEACKTRGERDAELRLQPTIYALETRVGVIAGQVSQAPGPDQPGDSSSGYSPLHGYLDGTLTDRSGAAIPNISVSIQDGPETTTDALGKFTLVNVPPGPQLIVVQAYTGGSFNQNIYIEKDQVTYVNLVFDKQTTQLGLLSVIAPLNNSTLETEAGLEHRQIIFGRCDGLAQIFGGYDQFNIWVLVRDITNDLKFWVQNPAAIVDSNNNTWQTSIFMGSNASPPQTGQVWAILAIAVARDSGIERIRNVSNLTDFPFQVISSNVVYVTIEAK